MKLPDMDQKSCIASPATGSESWGGGRDPFDSPIKSMLHSPWIGRCRTKVDVLSSWSPPGVLIRPSEIGKSKFSLFGKYHLFRIESFRVDFRCVHRFQLLKVCDQYVTLPNSLRVQSVSGNNPGTTVFPNSWILDWSFEIIGWYSTNEPKGITGPPNGCPKRLS